MARKFFHRDRIQILLKYWGLRQKELCVPFEVVSAAEYSATRDLEEQGDGEASKKINNWESQVSKLLTKNRDLPSTEVTNVSAYLASHPQLNGAVSAHEVESALDDTDAKFFYFLGTSGIGAGDHANVSDQTRTAEQPAALVGGDTSEALHSGRGDQSGEGHLGNSLAPPVSSHYVGVRWPDTDGLRQHFSTAYSRTLGGSLPEKPDRKKRERVFFLYRLGLAGIENRDFWDGAITARDEQLQVVIRRIPARIYYDDPFEEWLFYEEAYYDSGSGVVYNGAGVIYGFHGGMTLLSRDGTMMPNEEKAYQKKLSLAHFDFRPALHPEQEKRDHNYYIGSIAMESDYNPKRDDYFAPTAYRCLLRKAPAGTKWDDVKASLGNPGRSATIPIGKHCERSNGILDFKDGKLWDRERDLKYDDHKDHDSWRWYFNRLNINRHVTDLLIACPSIYSRWPKETGAAAPVAITEEPRSSRNAGPRRRDKRRETTPE